MKTSHQAMTMNNFFGAPLKEYFTHKRNFDQKQRFKVVYIVKRLQWTKAQLHLGWSKWLNETFLGELFPVWEFGNLAKKLPVQSYAHFLILSSKQNI